MTWQRIVDKSGLQHSSPGYTSMESSQKIIWPLLIYEVPMEWMDGGWRVWSKSEQVSLLMTDGLNIGVYGNMNKLPGLGSLASTWCKSVSGRERQRLVQEETLVWIQEVQTSGAVAMVWPSPGRTSGSGTLRGLWPSQAHLTCAPWAK